MLQSSLQITLNELLFDGYYVFNFRSLYLVGRKLTMRKLLVGSLIGATMFSVVVGCAGKPDTCVNSAPGLDSVPDNQTLKNMPVGTVGYAVPWALYRSGKTYVLIDTLYESYDLGTAAMKVEKTREGYNVWLPKGYKDKPVEGYGDLPVNKVLQGDQEWQPCQPLHLH
jgi:hypothetical protein